MKETTNQEELREQLKRHASNPVNPQEMANTSPAHTGAMNAAQSQTINLTPNYKGIFARMLGEAKSQSKAGRMFGASFDESKALRQVQRWFAPLTVAVNAASSVADLEELRDVMTDILSDIDRTAGSLENDVDVDVEAAAAYRRGFEDGKKGLL